jgi:uncharacterized lipoprotein
MKMKTSLIAVFTAAALLAGCAHTHYTKKETYIQDTNDCVLKTSEWGVKGGNNVDDSERTRYPNTHCAAVIGGTQKVVAAPAVYSAPTVVYAQPATTVSTKRVYLRSKCGNSFGTWCE